MAVIKARLAQISLATSSLCVVTRLLRQTEKRQGKILGSSARLRNCRTLI